MLHFENQVVEWKKLELADIYWAVTFQDTTSSLRTYACDNKKSCLGGFNLWSVTSFIMIDKASHENVSTY